MNADVFVGSSTGALKGINLHSQTQENLESLSGLRPPEHEITCMCWWGNEQLEILCAQMNRTLKLYNSRDGSVTQLFDANAGEGEIKGIQAMQCDNILTGVSSGAVTVWDREGEIKTQIEAGQDLCRVRCSPVKPSLVASGGKENPLKLWDVNSNDKPTFVAKNVPPDWLHLRVPVWVNDMQFLPDSQQIVTCTGHHQVRVYDPRANQRRPVTEIKWLDHPLTTLCCSPNPNQVIVANAVGSMAAFDIRNKGRLEHVYKGFAGAIRSVACHPTEPYIASCGLDRFLRLHHLKDRKITHKVYCKTRLNCLLMRDDLSFLKEAANDGRRKNVKDTVDSDGERWESDDDVWDSMNPIVDKSTKRKNEPEIGIEQKKRKVKSAKRKVTQETEKSVKKRKKMLLGSKRKEGLDQIDIETKKSKVL